MEIKLKKFESERGKENLEDILNKVSEQLDKAIFALQDLNLKKDQIIDPDKMDIDMIGGCLVSARESSLQKSGNVSVITTRRDNELANIKIQYEE